MFSFHGVDTWGYNPVIAAAAAASTWDIAIQLFEEMPKVPVGGQGSHLFDRDFWGHSNILKLKLLWRQRFCRQQAFKCKHSEKHSCCPLVMFLLCCFLVKWASYNYYIVLHYYILMEWHLQFSNTAPTVAGLVRGRLLQLYSSHYCLCTD